MIVNECNDTFHRTMKMESIDVKFNMYIDFDEENNVQGPWIKVDDQVRIFKYKSIFQKTGTLQVGLKKLLR